MSLLNFRAVILHGTILLTASGSSHVNADEAELLSKLTALDEVYAASLRASGTVKTTFPDPANEPKSLQWRYTASDGRQAIEQVETFPPFQTAVSDEKEFGRSFRIDDRGKMNIVAPTASAFLFDIDVSGESTTNSGLRIGPDNSVEETSRSYSIEQAPPDDRKNSYYLFRLLFTMGRGYSPYITSIDSVTSERSESGGGELLRVRAVGQGLTSRQGVWDLTIVPGESYLIRRANYTVDGAPEPLFTVANDGSLRTGACSVAAKGRFSLGSGPVATIYEVTFDTASLESDAELLAKVRDQVIDSVPPRSYVEDRRTDPPRLYRIDTEGQILGDSAAAVHVDFTPSPPTGRRIWTYRVLLLAGNGIFVIALLCYWGTKKWKKRRWTN
ncbi:MAG: hypothetical protein M3552_16445 [Planctomycetota bacterium]|nr:hypothetical protein [Planctomycetota bacterium]